MSLLKKLFAKKEEPAPESGRLPRVRVTQLHRISFDISPPLCKAPPLELTNLSTGGMGLVRRTGGLEVDQELTGRLWIDQTDYACLARIRYLNAAMIGCLFVGENLELKRAIEAYLRVEILALSLRRVDPAFLKPDARGEVHWFTDGRQNELYCVTDDSGVVAYHMSFLGTYVDGERDGRPRVGTVASEENGGIARHKGAELVDLTSAPVGETLRHASIFVENIEPCDPAVRASVRELLAR